MPQVQAKHFRKRTSLAWSPSGEATGVKTVSVLSSVCNHYCQRTITFKVSCESKAKTKKYSTDEQCDRADKHWDSASTREQREPDTECEFKGSLVYTVSFRSIMAT